MGAMAEAIRHPRKTVEDYMALPEGVRAELVGGEILVSPAPTPLHQIVGDRIAAQLRAWGEARRAGTAITSPLDVHLPSEDIVQPDVVFVSYSRRAIVQDGIRGVPDLVVEVLSPSDIRRDRVVKRQL
jgi:Uma2 family endonuclease